MTNRRDSKRDEENGIEINTWEYDEETMKDLISKGADILIGIYLTKKVIEEIYKK